MTTAVQLAQSVAPGVSLGFKNRIINGGMTIDQRNAGASVSTTAANSGSYTIDRWQYLCNADAKFTVQQNAGAITPPVGYTNYVGLTSTSAYSVVAGDYFGIRQPIEGLNMSDFAWGTVNAAPVTISFWVRSSLTGTFGGAVENSSGTRSYPFSYTISSANTWEQKSITIAGDTTGTWLTTNGVGLRVMFSIGVGSTWSGTANTWSSTRYFSVTGATSVVGTSGATFYITGVQLEVGTAATNFEFRDYGRELILCQRYYATSGTINTPNLHGANYDGTIWIGNAYYAVTMRSVPTITVLSGGTASIGTVGVSGLWFYRSSSAAYLTGYTASAEL